MEELRLGTIKLGYEIGHKGGSGRNKHILAACPNCGKLRWVQLIGDRPRHQRCKRCVSIQYQRTNRGENNPNWRGGTRINRWGYRQIRIYRENPFFTMANPNGYILEHRLIMAQHLGRPLMSNEQVHHKNGNKLDNKLDNLELISPREHGKTHFICHDCLLKKEIRLLRWELKELKEQLKYKMSL